MADETTASPNLLMLTAEIVTSHVANNRLGTGELPNLIQSVHSALAGLGSIDEEAPAEPEHVPAVGARKSVADPNFIISMIDGKAYKTLTRHLTKHGLTPAEYRERYGLRNDYPVVAAAYSETRRALAKTLGLGRKAGQKVVKAAAAAEKKVEEAVAPKRGRKPKGLNAALEKAKTHLRG